MANFLSRVDHIVYATPDLDQTVADIERLLGVRATPGGRHATWATRNALLALGDRTYLEIVGPDHGTARAESGAPRPFRIDTLQAPRLVTWAAKAEHLDRMVSDAKQHGIELGPVERGVRERPDGTVLRWTMTDLDASVGDGLVPFLIDWGDSPHPATTSARAGDLIGLRGGHPDAGTVRATLEALGLDLPVVTGTAPALVATIRTPRRDIELG